MRASTAVVVVLVGLVSVGCDAASGSDPVRPGSLSPDAGAASHPSTSPAPPSASAEKRYVAATAPHGDDEQIQHELVLDCGQSIATLSEPDVVDEVVLDVVAPQTSARSPIALQTQAAASSDPRTRLWAKSGLVIRGGAQFQLVVPDSVVDRFAFGWGSPAPMAQRVMIPGCGRDGEWLAFAGGFSGSKVGCLPADVTAGGSTQTVTVGFGAPCPGQDPPPEPTDT